jgi:uncharacterized protein
MQTYAPPPPVEEVEEPQERARDVPAVDERPAPVPPGQRIAEVDVLRGFAIFGILLVNMAFFSSSFISQIVGLGRPTNLVDQLARWGIAFFAEGKFYSTFAFLFGLGMVMQYERAMARGERFVPFFARRMGVLLLIGLVHAYLFWIGDILIMYSLLGIVLLFAFRNRRPRTLLVWVGVLLLVPLLLNTALYGLTLLAQMTPGGAAMLEQAVAEQQRQFQELGAQVDRVYATGSFIEVTRQRASDMLLMYATWPFTAFNVLAMMVLGVYAGKQHYAVGVAERLPFLRRVWWWSLLIGVAGNLAYVVSGELSSRMISSPPMLLSLAGQTIGAPALSVFYMTSLALLMQRPAWRARLAPLANVGRMAISNYLLQTVICTTLFYGYGFGLYGRMGVAAGVLLTLAIYAVQIPLSAWWLRRFRFGPVEWLWRTLTYGRRQPMRQAA